MCAPTHLLSVTIDVTSVEGVAFLLFVLAIIVYGKGWRNFLPGRIMSMKSVNEVIDAVANICEPGSVTRGSATLDVAQATLRRRELRTAKPYPWLRGRLEGLAMELQYTMRDTGQNSSTTPMGVTPRIAVHQVWEFALRHTRPNTLGLLKQNPLHLMKEIEVDDPEFDRRYLVLGNNPAWIQAVLGREVRDKLVALRDETESRLTGAFELRLLDDGRAIFRHPVMQVPDEVVEVVRTMAQVLAAIDATAAHAGDVRTLFA